jgi:hypothetical protein
MKGEQDPRRRLITDTIVRLGQDLGAEAIIYDAGRVGTERDRRARCLRALIEDAAQHPASSIVLDLDETLVNWDRQRLIEYTRASGSGARVTYTHRRRHDEQMLGVRSV